MKSLNAIFIFVDKQNSLVVEIHAKLEQNLIVFMTAVYVICQFDNIKVFPDRDIKK